MWLFLCLSVANLVFAIVIQAMPTFTFKYDGALAPSLAVRQRTLSLYGAAALLVTGDSEGHDTPSNSSSAYTGNNTYFANDKWAIALPEQEHVGVWIFVYPILIVCLISHPLFFKMAQNLDLGCVLISDPGTLGAGAKIRLESRVKKFTPHCICIHCICIH